MKISGSPSSFPWAAQENVLSALSKKPIRKSTPEGLPQSAGQPVKFPLSGKGPGQYHGQLSSAAQPEDLGSMEDKFIPMDQIPYYCQSINFGISLGGGLQEIGQKYAEKYDEIIQNHGKGNRVVIQDEQTGELRDATLEEKLAVLDKSFEDALAFEKRTEEQRPALIKALERSAENDRACGATDLAEEIEYKLERLKQIPKLPEHYQENMLQIREQFKGIYAASSKDTAWESMLEAIRQLLEQ